MVDLIYPSCTVLIWIYGPWLPIIGGHSPFSQPDDHRHQLQSPFFQQSSTIHYPSWQGWVGVCNRSVKQLSEHRGDWSIRTTGGLSTRTSLPSYLQPVHKVGWAVTFLISQSFSTALAILSFQATKRWHKESPSQPPRHRKQVQKRWWGKEKVLEMVGVTLSPN